jgi:hypothetical protein
VLLDFFLRLAVTGVVVGECGKGLCAEQRWLLRRSSSRYARPLLLRRRLLARLSLLSQTFSVFLSQTFSVVTKALRPFVSVSVLPPEMSSVPRGCLPLASPLDIMCQVCLDLSLKAMLRVEHLLTVKKEQTGALLSLTKSGHAVSNYSLEESICTRRDIIFC